MNLLTLPNGIYFFISTWIQLALTALFLALTLVTGFFWFKRRVRIVLVSSTLVLILGLTTAAVTVMTHHFLHRSGC
jgi:ABC-type Co2+ transport system permease subunit